MPEPVTRKSTFQKIIEVVTVSIPLIGAAVYVIYSISNMDYSLKSAKAEISSLRMQVKEVSKSTVTILSQQMRDVVLISVNKSSIDDYMSTDGHHMEEFSARFNRINNHIQDNSRADAMKFQNINMQIMEIYKYLNPPIFKGN